MPAFHTGASCPYLRSLLAVGNDAQFVGLCEALGREELPEDERFATNHDRVANRMELEGLLQKEFSKKTVDEWVEVIRGADVPCGPVNDLADVFSDEHARSSGGCSGRSSIPPWAS